MAREHGSRLIQAGQDFRQCYRDGRTEIECAVAGDVVRLDNLALGMRGPHQGANAAVAVAVIAELQHQGWCVSLEAMRDGLTNVRLPGRVEHLPGDPAVVIDTAHNPASARALAVALAEIHDVTRRTLILAASSDKDVSGIVRELAPHFDRVIVTEYQNNPRAVPAGRLADLVRANVEKMMVIVAATPRDAWRVACREAESGELVCIAGSFYLAAEMRPLLREAKVPTTIR
jgi:dihydrofolate synthase/folylpolyglutamate synthase